MLDRSLNLHLGIGSRLGVDENSKLANDALVLNSSAGNETLASNSLGSRMRLHDETHVARATESSDQIQSVIRLLQQLLKFDLQDPYVKNSMGKNNCSLYFRDSFTLVTRILLA